MRQQMKVAIGLGSNLGDRLGQIRLASKRLVDDFLESAQISSIYESDPWGFTDQPKFLNAVIVGECDWKPAGIINYLKQLEKELGRHSSFYLGPREIDLDLLLYGDIAWESGEGSSRLTVPHPGIVARDFVLLPLLEVWPEAFHPVLKLPIRQLWLDYQKTQPVSAKVVEPPLLDIANLSQPPPSREARL